MPFFFHKRTFLSGNFNTASRTNLIGQFCMVSSREVCLKPPLTSENWAYCLVQMEEIPLYVSSYHRKAFHNSQKLIKPGRKFQHRLVKACKCHFTANIPANGLLNKYQHNRLIVRACKSILRNSKNNDRLLVCIVELSPLTYISLKHDYT